MTYLENQNRKITIGSIPFEVASVSDAAAQLLQSASSGTGTSVRLSNAYCVALASSDKSYLQILRGPGVNYPDGSPIAWFMRRQDKSAQQVRGPSLFNETLRQSSSHGTKHFFLGSSPETLKLLRKRVEERFPDTRIAGTYSPPFQPLGTDLYDACANAVAEVDADLIWVALGTPKQDFVAHELSKRTGKTIVAVGAAFDFTAGTVKEAPAWTRRFGMEWAFRLIVEPRRLWKRYLIGNVQFLLAVLRSKETSVRAR